MLQYFDLCLVYPATAGRYAMRVLCSDKIDDISLSFSSLLPRNFCVESISTVLSFIVLASYADKLRGQDPNNTLCVPHWKYPVTCRRPGKELLSSGVMVLLIFWLGELVQILGAEPFVDFVC